jgi:dolichol-phosphate mannosyltransferase
MYFWKLKIYKLSDSLVIIPTYNEKENIEKIIHKVFSLAHPFHVLIIDDGSPDGTASIVKHLQSIYPERLFIEERSGKQGLGTAYIHGFKWALNHTYEFIFEMDADFSHNPDDLMKLREACVAGADVAIGSRYIKGVNVVNWPMGRVLMSYFASVYVRLITGIDIQDATAGFKCYRKQVLETIEFHKIKFVGYAFQIEMKFTAIKHGFNVVEIPIIFTDRTEGTSKMSTKIFREAFLGVIEMKTRSWFRTYKQKSA